MLPSRFFACHVLSSDQERVHGEVDQGHRSKRAGEEAVASLLVQEQPHIINLMDALRASVANAEKGNPKKEAKPAKQMAKSKGKERHGRKTKTSGACPIRYTASSLLDDGFLVRRSCIFHRSVIVSFAAVMPMQTWSPRVATMVIQSSPTTIRSPTLRVSISMALLPLYGAG
jgi:hypothetical protein